MHTLLVIGGGFLLLGACLGIAKIAGGSAAMGKGALVFLPLWLIGAAINLMNGVRAGYTIREELPVFVLIFAVPAAAAILFWRHS
ncbi:MAG: hypothetical protein HYX27_01670 [Acidobacteria bacterium]|nr:hypothetical protein [Acidobacteriota bacterium]